MGRLMGNVVFPLIIINVIIFYILKCEKCLILRVRRRLNIYLK